VNTSNKKQLIKAHDLTFQPYLLAETIAERVKEMGAELSQQYNGKNPLMIAILNGSFVFAADLMRACQMDCEVSFVKLSSYEGTGSTGKVTDIIGLGENIKGRHVIIVEDIIDSGKTMLHFLNKLKELEPDSISIVALLLKPDVFGDQFPIDHVGFEIPNKFVIGYGLDYNGLCRNLSDIYQLHQP
jgi:hypoxanthine phosphoribosyltransferase